MFEKTRKSAYELTWWALATSARLVTLPIRLRRERAERYRRELVELIRRCLDQQELVACRARGQHVVLFVHARGQRSLVEQLPDGLWDDLLQHLVRMKLIGTLLLLTGIYPPTTSQAAEDTE